MDTGFATDYVQGETCFSSLLPYESVFSRAQRIMEILASNGLGLGEVLRDYAEQTAHQMHDFSDACQCLLQGNANAEMLATLKSAYGVLSSAATVLDMIPAAMQRNGAASVGEKHKVSREDIVRMARLFRESPEIRALMQSEEACISALQRALHGKAMPAMALPAAAAGLPGARA